MTDNQIPLAIYLLRRLHQLGVRSILGVPGDYNLALLDYIYKVDGLNWVGNCNELNAAYAADGYARIKGLSALITTFGVGELSAINGVAGAYAEYVPIVHIVGCPSTSSQRQHAVLHHSLGDGDFHVFKDMAKAISRVQVYLDDPETAPHAIDRALTAAYVHARPVYILLPSDMAPKTVSPKRLHQELDLSLPRNDPETESDILAQVLALIYKAKCPIVLADACSVRHGVVPEVRALLEKLQVPCFVTPMGKSTIDETSPYYGGVYIGQISHVEVKNVVERSDLVLSIGAILSDFNTGEFSYHIEKSKKIEFHSTWTVVRYAQYPGIAMKYFLQRLIEEIDPSKISRPVNAKDVVISNKELLKDEKDSSSTVTHAWLWPTLGTFMRPKDILITETGTSSSGVTDTRFPKDVIAISQVLWGSIGYATGACLGAALAARELPDGEARRVILFTGEGSFQLTAQEVSTMIRRGLKPIIVVINNNGYAVEKLIHGADKGYNFVADWKYTKILEAFGAKDPRSFRVSTKDEFTKFFSSKEFTSPTDIQLVELMMGELDAPRALKIQGQLTGELNAQ